MKKIFSISVAAFALSVLLAACGGSNKSRSLLESVSSFLNGNEAVVGFGAASLGDVLTKTDYESEAKIKALMNGTIGQLKSSVNMDEPIYFALEGPLSNGNPTATYLFLEVKNADSLKVNLTKNGFEVKEGKAFQYFQDGDLNLAFDKHLAVALIQNNVEDPVAALSTVYNKTKGDVSTGYIADILKKKDDLVYGVNLANLYGTSNTDLEDLSADKQKELRAMLQNSFVEMGLRFEDGAIVMESKNHFSEALKSKLFLGTDAGAKILNNLGKGRPFMGASLNIDAKRLQEFLNEYAPNAMRDLSEDIGGEFEMAMALADYDVSKVIDGRMGALIFGDIASVMGEEGVTPDLNFFVGLAGYGKTFGTALKGQMADNFEVVNLTDTGIFAYTSSKNVGNAVSLPDAGTNFGKNTFNFFIDLSDVDLSSFQLEGPSKFAEMVKYVQIDYGIAGGKITIQARDGKENILKQVFRKALNLFEDELSMM